MPAPLNSFSSSSSASPSSPAVGGCRTSPSMKTAATRRFTPLLPSTRSSSSFRFSRVPAFATAISRSNPTSSALPLFSRWCFGPPPRFVADSRRFPKSRAPASGFTPSSACKSFLESSLCGRASFPPTIPSRCCPWSSPRSSTPSSVRSSLPLPSLPCFCAIVLYHAKGKCSSLLLGERCLPSEQLQDGRARAANEAWCVHRTHQAGSLFARAYDHRRRFLYGCAWPHALAAHAARHFQHDDDCCRHRRTEPLH